MRIRETCNCGASVEVRLKSPAVAREAVDHWRDSHRHEVRDTAPVGAQWGLVAQDGTTGNGRLVDCEGCEICDALQLRPGVPPVGTQDGQQAVIDPDGWVCSDCGGSPVDCGRGIRCMAERAPLPASGQQAAPIAHEGETVLFDLARMASGQAYPVTISGQRVVAVKDHQGNINFYPLNADATAERANDSPGELR